MSPAKAIGITAATLGTLYLAAVGAGFLTIVFTDGKKKKQK